LARKYYYKTNNGKNWLGPLSIWKLLGEFLNSKVGANTEVWHQGICHLIKNYMLCPRKKVVIIAAAESKQRRITISASEAI
jgi:hypothetical protein